MTPMFGMVMTMLQHRNPQMFQNITQAMNSGQDPTKFAKQVFGKMDSKQKENILNQASQLGCPKEILTQIQNMK